MGDHKDEQEMEIEALESIYAADFKAEEISTQPFRYSITLKPNDDSSGEQNFVMATLSVSVPLDYPDVPPDTKISSLKGLSKKQEEELQNLVEEQAQENLGMPSVFTIAEAAKEWLIGNNIEGQDGSMYAEMLRRQVEREKVKTQNSKPELDIETINRMKSEASPMIRGLEDDEEWRKKRLEDGTEVSTASFLEWKTKFDEEFAMEYQSERAELEGDTSKLSGKQMFIMKIEGTEVDADEDEEEEEEEGDDDDEQEYEEEEGEDGKGGSGGGGVQVASELFGAGGSDGEESLDGLSDIDDDDDGEG